MRFAALLLVPLALFGDAVTSNVETVRGRLQRHVHWIPDEERFTEDVLPSLAEAEALGQVADELVGVYSNAQELAAETMAPVSNRVEALKARPVVTLTISADPENAVDRRNLTMVVMSNEVSRIPAPAARVAAGRPPEPGGLASVEQFDAAVAKLVKAGYREAEARAVMAKFGGEMASREAKRASEAANRAALRAKALASSGAKALAASAPYGVRVRAWVFGNAVLRSAPTMEAWVCTKLGTELARVKAAWAGDGYGTNGVTIVHRGEEYECFELGFDIPPEVYDGMTVLLRDWIFVGDPQKGFDYGNRQRRINGQLCVTTNDLSWAWASMTTTNGTDLTEGFLPYLDRGELRLAEKEKEESE